MKDMVKFYFSRLNYWKKQMNLKGYTKFVFYNAKEDVKKWLKKQFN